MRAAIYARISDDPEGREAGVTRQVEDCEGLIAMNGWGMSPYQPFIDNDISASTLSKKRRPKYEDLIELVRQGEIDAIVYYTNGRLTRRPREYEDLIELHLQTGVTYASVKSVDADLSTADGRMIARVLAAQDAAEAERISERVRRANVQRRAQGKPEPSSRAFGFEKGGERLVSEEAELIREAAHRVADEGWSLGDVQKDWNKRGVKTVRGAQWSRTTVSRALTSPRTAGLLSLKGEVVGPGEFDGIITPELRKRVMAQLDTKRGSSRVTFKQRKNVLSGFLVCGKCGKPMHVNALLNEDGTWRKDSYVVCSRSQQGCGNVKRNLLHVNGYIDGIVRNRIEMFEPMGDIETGGDEMEAQIAELNRRLEEVNEDIADLQVAFNSREIRFKDYNSALATLRTSQELIEKSIAETGKRAKTEPDIDLLAAWEDGSVEERRAVLEWVIDHIKIHPVGRGMSSRALIESLPTSCEVVFRS